MEINGREVRIKKRNRKTMIDLLLKEGDCPKRYDYRTAKYCKGECNGSYLTLFLENGDLKRIGTISQRPIYVMDKELGVELYIPHCHYVASTGERNFNMLYELRKEVIEEVLKNVMKFICDA